MPATDLCCIMHLLKIFATVVLSALLLSACYNDKADKLYPVAGGCDTTHATYAAVVRPVISSNCAYSGCHAGSGASAGINLETVAGLQSIAASGDLIGTITHASGHSPMPKNRARLPDCDISQISAWVNAGAQNN